MTHTQGPVTPIRTPPRCELHVQDSYTTLSGETVVEYQSNDGEKYVEFVGRQGKQWMKHIPLTY